MVQMIDDDKDYIMNEKGGASAWKNRNKLRIASDGEAPVPLNKMNSK